MADRWRRLPEIGWRRLTASRSFPFNRRVAAVAPPVSKLMWSDERVWLVLAFRRDYGGRLMGRMKMVFFPVGVNVWMSVKIYEYEWAVQQAMFTWGWRWSSWPRFPAKHHVATQSQNHRKQISTQDQVFPKCFVFISTSLIATLASWKHKEKKKKKTPRKTFSPI